MRKKMLGGLTRPAVLPASFTRVNFPGLKVAYILTMFGCWSLEKIKEPIF